jgi:hypothetical protein
MASPAQLNANRSNARQSTGPRTADGKARVSQNAVRHGLTGRHPVVRNDEREAFAALRDGLAAELDPQGALEELAFQQILLAAKSSSPPGIFSASAVSNPKPPPAPSTTSPTPSPLPCSIASPSTSPAPSALFPRASANSASCRPIAPYAPANWTTTRPQKSPPLRQSTI